MSASSEDAFVHLCSAQTEVPRRVRFLFRKFGIEDLGAFVNLLKEVDGVVIAPAPAWTLYPQYQICAEERALYIWAQNVTSNLLRRVSFFVGAPGYEWPMDKTATWTTSWHSIVRSVDPVHNAGVSRAPRVIFVYCPVPTCRNMLCGC